MTSQMLPSARKDDFSNGLQQIPKPSSHVYSTSPSENAIIKIKPRSKKNSNFFSLQTFFFIALFFISSYIFFAYTQGITLLGTSFFSSPIEEEELMEEIEDFSTIMDEMENFTTTNLSLNQSCGSWQKDYIQFHSQSVYNYTRDLPHQVLIYYCNSTAYDCGGLGDQLTGIKTSFLISLLLRRAFFIYYSYFASSFQPLYVDWRHFQAVDIHECDRIMEGKSLQKVFRTLNTRKCLHISMINNSPWSALTFDWIQNVSANYERIVFRCNHGNSIAFLESERWWGRRLRQWGFTQDNISGCLLRFLIRPRLSIRKRVEEMERVITSPPTFSVCIHIRMIRNGQGDDTYMLDSYLPYSAYTELFQNFSFVFKCAQKITDHFAKPDQQVRWFLASSSSWLKEKAYYAYPDKILKLGIVPRHIGANLTNFAVELQNLVAEWYLLSKCQKFVFLSSGLSKTSVAYSLSVNSSYMFPHKLFNRGINTSSEWEKYCVPSAPTPIHDMASEWSGM